MQAACVPADEDGRQAALGEVCRDGAATAPGATEYRDLRDVIRDTLTRLRLLAAAE
ncbi:hypothetical protein ACWCXE_33310 [Streptomyces sp. NPDC001780]